MDLDLRKLRYFAAVARHLHFGRAAGELFITQPALSRQVAALEVEVGCALLTRTSRRVALTPAGERLRDEAPRLLGLVEATLVSVSDAARGQRRLVVAFVPGLHVADAVRAYARTRPDVDVELLRLDWWEQDAALRDGRADVGYLRLPFDTTGLRVEPIATEAKLACMAAGHPLASRQVLCSSDLDDHVVLDARERRTSSVEEKFELVAAGDVVALVPRSVVRAYPREDVVWREVVDGVVVDTVLAAAEGREEKHLSDFFDVASDVLRLHPGAPRPSASRSAGAW